ncbi:uncharacterized protein LOC133324788 [Musca vetustissima]|uniref:uncharacterized protein LOC133324788 n=1 Tax=Musca vetustissima TaxID=27455 RepID=UPI002AB7B7FC|nr:uncharacterized protein LOC133324788 [Musca vetustissima]
MYRQRILFRQSTDDPIEDYELLTVTFGVNCAPYLALRTLQKLAEDIKDVYPRAANIILNNLYVYDVLAGGHTEEESIEARKELTAALASAGFQLMQRASNDHKIIEDIPQEKLLPLNWLDISEDASTKTLGIRWNIFDEFFSFTPPAMEKHNTATKREVLSTIAKLFDPCGWLAPVLVVAKLIMQQIWQDKIGWDDPLKPMTQINWNNFVKNSKEIEFLKVPRWIRFTADDSVEIHEFCDASENAYGATLYIRIENKDSSTHAFLLTAKTRVTPIKKLSIPRLELCGAVLLSKLGASIIKNLQITSYSTHFWTDSKIVLAWLKKHPCHWNAFVGNRISDISENVGQENLRHVDSESNLADIASRGCAPLDLKTQELWRYGPQWLKLPKARWPSYKVHEDTSLEAKTVKALTLFQEKDDPLKNFSSLSRVYRTHGENRQHLRKSSTDLSALEVQDGKRANII